MSPFSENFKREMEADAAERAEHKRRAKIRSDEWKEKAIKSFREGKHDDALENYTKVNENMGYKKANKWRQ